MLNTNYYNDFFDFGQQKINFSFFELHLPDDDPVYTLKKVMEEMDFSSLTFHRWKLPAVEEGVVLCIYLGGYHNRTKRQFLKNLYDVYPQAEYYHFGDIDCGGFRIWKDLCKKTEIPFGLLGMDCDTYRRYLKFGRDLTELDKKTLQRMLEDPFFEGQRELFQMMLEKGKKLEQECVEM